MDISEFAFKLLLLFLPGLTCYQLVKVLTTKQAVPLHTEVVFSVLLGLFCYFIYYLVAQLPCLGLTTSFFESLNDKGKPIEIAEVGITTLLSMVLAIPVAGTINHKLFHRFARKLGVTTRHGDAGVWSYILNSDIPEWVVVRDFKNNLMYEGWVHVFSDNGEEDEMFLRDVIVYRNSDGVRLYETPALYIPTERAQLTIEFPQLSYSDYHNRQTNAN